MCKYCRIYSRRPTTRWTLLILSLVYLNLISEYFVKCIFGFRRIYLHHLFCPHKVLLRTRSSCSFVDKLIEVWQANAGGRYRHKKDGYTAPLDVNFGGCGRCITGEDGSYSFRTILPGAYPWPNGGNDWRPAHIHFSVFGDGFAQRVITQMYFEGDPHIALCPIVQSIPDAAAIDRLVARLDMAKTIPMDIRAYRFDIVLRGRSATPFENAMEGT